MTESNMSPWQRFMGILQLERRDLMQVFYYAIFSGIVALSLPLGIQAIINLIQGAQVSTSWIVLVILVTAGTAFSGGLHLMQLRIIETIQQRIFVRASFELSFRFPKIKMSHLRDYYPPELANRFFDTLIIQKGLAKILIDVPTAVLQIIFALILLSFYHPFFIFFGILLLTLILVIFRFTARQGLKTSLKESKDKYRVAHWIQEVARSLVSFKLSGNTNFAVSKNDLLVADYLKSREGHFKILMLQFIQMISFKVIVTASLLLIGGGLVLTQEMNIGQFVAAEIIILLIISSVEKLIIGLESFYDVLTSIEKIGQIVDIDLENQTGENILADTELDLELRNVYYDVPDRDVHILDDINLKINQQSRVLLLGESGAGKSSLLRLIAGINEPTSGYIHVNNFSIKSIKPNDYRALLGLSLTEETPFEGTIKDNLTFGNTNITDKEIFHVLENVGLIEYVKDQPKGLHTILYPDGKRMSHTVSKKIVLARAILKKPKLLILEDALDRFNPKETNAIINYLADKKRPWGLIVVSGNPIWNSKCNKVIELDKGRIKTRYNA
ncbi:peptidase domain-containing ABC transporter [Gaetbulibacter saemankumensis]|uniref:peptidase domain-containing ABC transporter n=1 Tax=Gaetbulibacter saemankumensis TaxID=311208 RepID=UPI000480B0F2|nr:ATP-binding cassette domain-containing protein [Gaetbulibacter saemankumensis]